jgi:ABC-type multidrug transport system ATPase subunit
MINVVDVTHHYGIRPVLRSVSLTINKGEVVALMGPNGMGKSTLMGVIAGILSPIKGHVEIDGKRRRSSPENELAIRQRVVYLPADSWVPPNKTGREWMLAVGRLYKVDDDRLMNHIDRLLDVFDLTKQADSLISGYSTGQKRKIALCCTLVTEAPIVLMDEPFSGGLDPSALLALKRILQHLASRDDVTILIATPVPELVAEIADKVAFLREGRIVAYDTLLALASQTGFAQLDEIYETLVNPSGKDAIGRYLEGQAP